MIESVFLKMTKPLFIGLLGALFFIHLPRMGRAAESSPALTISSKDGKSALSFHLTTQFRWEYAFIDRGASHGRTTDSNFLFRRLRPVIKGRLLTRKVTYLMHLNVVPGALELMDLWMDFQFLYQLRMRIGQMKVPFTRYRLNSFKDRPVLDWSNPTRYFGAERQIGVMFHNGLGHPPIIEYQLGIYTGVNARASNGIGIPLIYGASIPNNSNLASPDSLDNMHAELALHLAFNPCGINIKRPSDLEGGPFRYAIGISLAWDFKPTPMQDMRLRFAPEILLKAHHFSFSGVFLLGLSDRLAGGGSYKPGVLGGVAQVSYLFAKRYELAFRYTVVHILSGLGNDARQQADARIARASAQGEKDALTAQYVDVGLLRTEHELNLGFNIYILGTNLKWQIDGGLLIHSRKDGNRYDVLLRTQVQLAF